MYIFTLLLKNKYKNHYYLMINLLFNQIFYAQQPNAIIKLPSDQRDANIHINFHIAFNGQMMNPTLTTQATCDTQTIIETDINNHIQPNNNAQENMPNKFLYCTKNNIIFTTLCAIYGYLYLKIKFIEKISKNKKSWCCWQEEISLDALMLREKSHVITDIINEIKNKYEIQNNHNHSINNFIKFFEACQYESRMLQKYKTIYHITDKCYIKKIFPLSAERMYYIDLQIARINYLITLFFEWFTQHEQNHHNIP